MTPEEIRRQKLVEDVTNNINPTDDFIKQAPPTYEIPRELTPSSGTMELDPYTEIERSPAFKWSWERQDTPIADAIKERDVKKLKDEYSSGRGFFEKSGRDVGTLIQDEMDRTGKTEEEVIRSIVDIPSDVTIKKHSRFFDPIIAEGHGRAGGMYNPSTKTLHYKSGDIPGFAHEAIHAADYGVDGYRMSNTERSIGQHDAIVNDGDYDHYTRTEGIHARNADYGIEEAIIESLLSGEKYNPIRREEIIRNESDIMNMKLGRKPFNSSLKPSFPSKTWHELN